LPRIEAERGVAEKEWGPRAGALHGGFKFKKSYCDLAYLRDGFALSLLLRH